MIEAIEGAFEFAPPELTPIVRAGRIAAALERLDAFRADLYGAGSATDYIERTDHAIERLQTLQRRYDAQDPAITLLYKTAQALEDTHAQGLMGDLLYEQLRTQVEAQLSNVYMEAQGTYDARLARLALRPAPAATKPSFSVAGDTLEISRSDLIDRYDGNKLYLRDGRVFRGDRAAVLCLFLTQGISETLTSKDVAAQVRGRAGLSKASTLISQAAPILASLGFRVVPEQIANAKPNQGHGHPLKAYRLEPLALTELVDGEGGLPAMPIDAESTTVHDEVNRPALAPTHAKTSGTPPSLKKVDIPPAVDVGAYADIMLAFAGRSELTTQAIVEACPHQDLRLIHDALVFLEGRGELEYVDYRWYRAGFAPRAQQDAVIDSVDDVQAVYEVTPQPSLETEGEHTHHNLEEASELSDEAVAFVTENRDIESNDVDSVVPDDSYIDEDSIELVDDAEEANTDEAPMTAERVRKTPTKRKRQPRNDEPAAAAILTALTDGRQLNVQAIIKACSANYSVAQVATALASLQEQGKVVYTDYAWSLTSPDSALDTEPLAS